MITYNFILTEFFLKVFFINFLIVFNLFPLINLLINYEQQKTHKYAKTRKPNPIIKTMTKLNFTTIQKSFHLHRRNYCPLSTEKDFLSLKWKTFICDLIFKVNFSYKLMFYFLFSSTKNFFMMKVKRETLLKLNFIVNKSNKRFENYSS